MKLLNFPDCPCAAQIKPPLIPEQRLKIVEKNHVKNVFFLKNNEWLNLTNFSNPHHIYDYQISPDEKHAFVWHMDYPPRILSIYDLEEFTLVKDLTLKAGGNIRWNNENNLIHTYGCGSGCMVAHVLNIKGKTLFSIDNSPIEISPSGRYLAAYTVSWVGKQNLELYDLSHRFLIFWKTPIFILNGIGTVDSISWNDERIITVKYIDAYFDENDKPIKREVSVDLSRY
ncbi:MAG: hypothetical protein AB1390_12550 [Nitrospirota bacterium]